MKKNTHFHFKVIETKYRGYHFRSRLEARHAVFFDALGVRYEYEKEGYDLDGVWYLPDFWLPDLHYWIEIKGQEPTEAEVQKIQILALYTNTPACIVSGNICLPGTDETSTIRVEYPPSLGAVKYEFDPDGNIKRRDTKDITVSRGALLLIQKLRGAFITPWSNGHRLALYQEGLGCSNPESLPQFLNGIQKQYSILATLPSLLTLYEKELVEALWLDKGWELDFSEAITIDGSEWVECSACHEITLRSEERRV